MMICSARWSAVFLCLAVSGAAWCAPPAVPTPTPPQLPPRVVSCTPAPFTADVEVKLAQISITFDRPMKTAEQGGLAALRWLGVYPGAGKPVATWNADHTICRLPVKLDADITYAVLINPAGQRGFEDPKGAPALPFTWVFSTGTRTPGDFPPYVVSSDPPQAAGEVDPKKQEISVTFSRPVAPGDYSWTSVGAGVYPGVRDKRVAPKLSADRLTATLEVSLAPGAIYALSLNDVNHPGYKDTLGRPVAPYAWCFKTAGGPLAPPRPTPVGPAPPTPIPVPAPPPPAK